MFTNINKQKQIKIFDKLPISAKPSFFHIPSVTSNSFIQTSFSDKIFSESCFIPYKSFPNSNKIEPFFEKEQSRLFPTSYLRLYKKLYIRKRKGDIRNTKRILTLKKRFSSFMRFFSKSSSKNNFTFCPKLNRVSTNLNQKLQHVSLNSRKNSPNLKKTYTSFFKVFRNSILLRPLLFRSYKTKFKLAIFGLIHSVPLIKRRKYRKKGNTSVSFRTIKFFKKKEKFNIFNSLKIKTFLAN